MLRVKRLYIFILTTFLPVFLATFGVCLFVLLMQSLWRYVDDLVGKGLEMSVLGELFFYAGLTLVPLALPLAILLASLMTFGNLGERLELLAMKSAGISLIKIMRPLIVFLLLVSIGAFYFQNIVLPASYVKFYTLMISIRQKSPELDIPEGVFFSGVPGYNIYVGHKDRDSGKMKDLMIYNYSNGFENAAVIVADSGKMKASENKLHVILSLYNGKSFQNLREDRGRAGNTITTYNRETFSLKEILIQFDGNFNMRDESMMQGRDVSKNLAELRTSIDSMQMKSDSVSSYVLNGFRSYVYPEAYKLIRKDGQVQSRITNAAKDSFALADFDNYVSGKNLTEQSEIVNRARSKTESLRNDYQFQAMTQNDQMGMIRSHQIEFHRKFTLSVACLVFFFIGAPLGAIIRKGGLGMPTVISIFLFLFYYSIDIMGFKMAKQDAVSPWAGVWLSSIILFCLGFFLTYKAVNDSTMLNAEAWMAFFKRFVGKREVRNYQRKEVIMTDPDYERDLNSVVELDGMCRDYLNRHKKPPGYISFWRKGIEDVELNKLSSYQEEMIEDLRNSEQNLIIGKIMDYPILNIPKPGILKKGWMRWICGLLLPFGLIIYIINLMKNKRTKQDVNSILKINQDLTTEIQKLSERNHYA